MKFKLLFVLFFTSLFVSAQDVHLSQYFSAPLLLNPALTANIDGPFRVTSSYRQQWRQNGFSYNTFTASFENRLLSNKLQEHSRLGFGIALLGDESLGGVFKNNSALVSLSYHQPLDIDGITSIGAGLQANLGNRSINFNNLTYESQFNLQNELFDRNISSGEIFQNGVKSIFDLNAGLVYTYNDGSSSFYLGTSVYNIRRPEFTFFSDSSSRINLRKMLHSGANFYINESVGTKMTLSFLAMEQARSIELNFGGAFGIPISDYYLYLGSFYRFKDSFYPYISFQSKSLQIGISYDIMTSGLRKYNPKRSSIELSFLYVLPDDSEKRRFMPWNY